MEQKKNEAKVESPSGNFISNMLASGKPIDSDEAQRYIVLNIGLFVGGLFLIIYGILVYQGGNVPRALSDFAMSVICFGIIILLRTKLPFLVLGGIGIGAFGFLCIQFVYTVELNGFEALWVFIYPLISIFILGLQVGLVYSMLLFCAMLTFTVIPGLALYSYSFDLTTRLVGVYLFITFLTVAYEQSKLFKDRRVSKLNNELRVERDVIAAMKDNMSIGLFLMDRNYVIQGAYSKPLEEILGTDEIEGKRFTDFLAASLKAKERETLEDYFKMVLTRQFDTKMLSEINPIAEFSYIDNISGKTKILRTVFATVDQGLNDYYVLGSVEDITATKELQRQLELESVKREEEMKALFQVLQVDPVVFGDFIEDAESEFDRINEILKDKKLSAKEAMVHIYQSVHAIKANAVILGLDNFSQKLHELENTIKQYRDVDEVTFEDGLHVAVELEKIMKVKDEFRNTIKKIETFQNKTGGKEQQDRYVLVETLTKACEKAAKAEEKNAAFIVDEMDDSILEHSSRRIIKEVLTQLVRNAVSHGIEKPQDRQQSGKDSQGTIMLSMTKENGSIHLKLSDDGKGINFAKIRDKALKRKLISETEAESKSNLLRLIFTAGFSTADKVDLNAGRGIGLSLVHERIKKLKGSIKISSEMGKGTTFNIFIPLEEKSES